MLSLTEVFVDIYPNYNKIRDLFLLNWSVSKTLNQEITANAIQTFTEFSGVCYTAFRWCSLIGSNWILVKPSEIAWHK